MARKDFGSPRLAYAFSPIDPIPIPVLGYLDDIVIVPVGIYPTLGMIPEHVLADGGSKTVEWMEQRRDRPRNWFMAVPILSIWLFQAYTI